MFWAMSLLWMGSCKQSTIGLLHTIYYIIFFVTYKFIPYNIRRWSFTIFTYLVYTSIHSGKSIIEIFVLEVELHIVPFT